MRFTQKLSYILLLPTLTLTLGVGCQRSQDDDEQKDESGKGSKPANEPAPAPKSDDQSSGGKTDGQDSPPLVRGEPLFAASEVVCTPSPLELPEGSPAFCMNAKWQSALNIGSESKVILTLVTHDRYAPVQLAEVLEVLPWMPEHHHGQGDELTVISPVAGAIANEFLVGNIQFIMPGKWELRTKVKFSGQNASLFFPVEVP